MADSAKPGNLVEKLLLRDEGFRRSDYQDSLGFWTIGIGKLIDARKGGGITLAEAFFLLRNEIAEKDAGLRSYLPWYDRLDEVAVHLSPVSVCKPGNTFPPDPEGRHALIQDSRCISQQADHIQDMFPYSFTFEQAPPVRNVSAVSSRHSRH